MYTLTLVSDPEEYPLDYEIIEMITPVTGAKRLDFLSDKRACDLCDIDMHDGLYMEVDAALKGKEIDWCIQRESRRRKKLLISDMDSTIIRQECIDELADSMGIKDEVAAITERAMQGELDFSASLRARVALLKGLAVEELEHVWHRRIRLTEGATELVATMNAHGAVTMLVSGGFTFFTSRVAVRTGFTEHYANQLIVENECLTGKVQEPVLDQDSKLALLKEASKRYAIELADTIAVGDGANDAPMIEAAGLGVAFYAKPLLQERADTVIRYTNLRSLLYFQGYHDNEIIG